MLASVNHSEPDCAGYSPWSRVQGAHFSRLPSLREMPCLGAPTRAQNKPTTRTANPTTPPRAQSTAKGNSSRFRLPTPLSFCRQATQPRLSRRPPTTHRPNSAPRSPAPLTPSSASLRDTWGQLRNLRRHRMSPVRLVLIPSSQPKANFTPHHRPPPAPR